MSIRLMSAVWDTPLADSEKLILLALADWANDDGECWPSIAQLARKSSKGERTVQVTIQRLKEAGHLTRIEVPGRGCRYVIHPRSDSTPAATAPRSRCTPAEIAPAQPTTDTPAAAAPNTSRTTSSSSEASPPTKKRGSATDPFPQPEWADDQHWRDFLANRKQKRLPNTATAYRKFLADIDSYVDVNWPPGRILQHAAERGWAGIYDPRDSETANGKWKSSAGHQPSAAIALKRRAQAELASSGEPEDDGFSFGSWPALPAH